MILDHEQPSTYKLPIEICTDKYIYTQIFTTMGIINEPEALK